MTDRVRWGPGREDQFRDFLRYDLGRAADERQPLETIWRGYLEQYRAPEPKALRRFPFEGALLARDTEVLTIGGWRRVDSLRLGEPVLTRRDGDGALEWNPVEGSPQRYCEKLYHFKSRSIDLLVSDDHAMICEHQDRRGETVRMRADELWGKTGYFLPTTGKWAGGHYDDLFGLSAGDVCEFVGWYLAEGWSTHNSDQRPTGICIGQSRSANPEKCRRIESLLTRLGWRWSELSGNDGYYIGKPQIPVRLFDMLIAERGAANKRVPGFFFTLTPDLLDRLLTGLVMGDGCIFDNYPQGTQPKVNYYSISRGLANDVQVICLLAGLQARVRSRVRVGAGGVVEDGRQIQGEHRCYEVTISATPRAKYDRSFKEIVEYNDVAFCVTVKNHAIYARRNGTACWTGNSNLTFPLMAMNTDPIVARLIRTIQATSNLWTVTALNADWQHAAKPSQDFLEYVDKNMLHMQDVNYRALLETVKLGTGVYKTGWRYEKYNVMGYDQQMTRMRLERKLNQPVVDQVHMANFYLPPEAMSVDPDEQGGAQWVAERLRYRPEQLQALSTAQAPFFPEYDPDAVKAIINFQETSPTLYEQRVQQLDNMSGSFSRKWKRPVEIYEVWVRFDTTGNGHEDDIVVLWHQPTRTILRALYQPYAHGKRPYHVARYLRGDGFYGIGVGEQTRMWQTGITNILNYNIDKILLTNAPMIIAKEGANLLPNEPFYPSKTIFVSDPSKDIAPFFLAAPNSIDINQLLGYLQEGAKARTGLTDLQFGSVGAVPSRTPATTIQALLQEGNTRFDLIVQDLRVNSLGPIGLQVLQNIVQQVGNKKNNPEGANYVELAAMVLGQNPGEFVQQLIQLPNDRVEAGLGVELTATSGTNNKELARQSNLALLQVIGQWAPQMVQLAQAAVQSAGTPFGQIVEETFNFGREFLARTLEQFDVRDPDAIIPNLSAALAAAQAQAAGQPMAPLGGALQSLVGAPIGPGVSGGLPPVA